MHRQTLRKTRAELHRSLSEEGREFVMDTWTAAERLFTSLEALSPLTTLLGRTFIMAYAEAERLNGEEPQTAFLVVMMAGYATRMVLLEPTRQPVIERESVPWDLTPEEAMDIETLTADAERLKAFAEPLGTMAFEQFGEVMTLPAEVWAGYVSLATMQLQRNLNSRAAPRRLLDRERIEGMMRYGYVLRCLDETLGGEPELRPGALSTGEKTEMAMPAIGSESDGADLDDDQVAEALVEQAILVHTQTMSDEAERQIVRGAVVVLGEDAWDGWDEPDRDLAIIAARMGFMIRLAELQMFLEADNPDDPGWIPILDVLLELSKQAMDGISNDDEESLRTGIDVAVAASAHLFADKPESVDALLSSVPGVSASIREKSFACWIAAAQEKQMVPAGAGADGMRRLMIYGFGVAALREQIMRSQEKAGR